MPAPAHIKVTASTVLTLEFDIEERIASARPDNTLKGMFFQRIAELAEKSGVKSAQVPLRFRPANDRYLPFGDYPVADYFRWVHCVGRALYPRLSPSEAMRRVGHRDFELFAESKLGRVMLAFGGSARSTLARCGLMYGAILKGPKVTSDDTPEGVRILYRDFPGPVEVYPIGTIESLCKYYHAGYTIEISPRGPRDADYLVRITT